MGATAPGHDYGATCARANGKHLFIKMPESR